MFFALEQKPPLGLFGADRELDVAEDHAGHAELLSLGEPVKAPTRENTDIVPTMLLRLML